MRNIRNGKPIAWHPLFPAMIAVWFGALFGLGVLAVRVSLLERIAVASGIDLIIPAAAPPLGTNARILIALAFALLGGVIGATIGTLMARSKPSARHRRAEAAAAKAEAASQPEASIVAAAAEESDGPSFIDISELDPEADLRIERQPEPAEEVQAEMPGAAGAETGPVAAAGRRPPAPSFPLPEPFPLPGGAAARRLIAADLDSLSHLELIERLALSLQKRREEAGAAAVAEPVAADRPTAHAPVEIEPAPAQAPSYYPPAPELPARRFAAALSPAEPDHQADSAELDETAEGAYGSLLGSEQEAAAVSQRVARFPEPANSAASRQDSSATERALRDALATLQRMSGAA